MNYKEIATFAIFGLALVVYLIVRGRENLSRRRKKAAGRPLVSNEEFLNAIGAEPEFVDVYIAVREVMARWAKIPVEAIFPTDSVSYIRSMTTDVDAKTVDIVIALGDSLKTSISEDVSERIPFPFDKTPLSEAIRGMIECDAIQTLVRQRDAGQS